MARNGTEHIRIWIGRNDALIHRISEDTVLSYDQLRAVNAKADTLLREAGIEPMFVDSGFENRGLSTFTITTFHPKCGKAVDLEALQLTDGSF
jgi:hypothetical protein